VGSLRDATHPALVSDQLFAEVRGWMKTPRPVARKPRTSTHKYVLRGVFFCAHCGRRMEGAWRLYRCTLRDTRSIALGLADHPRSLYA
jgi:hypothetical protein